jgi:lipooligosaccharide transport system permease protein
VHTPLPLRVLEGHGRAYRHTWRGTTISAVVTPVLFLAAMGLGLGTLVDEGRAGGVGDVSYLVWLAPGLLAASAMQSGAADGAFPVMAGMRWIKGYHAAIHTPVRPRDLFLGNLAWAGLRLVVITSVFVVVASGFGAVALVRGFAALLPAVLTGVATCAAVSAFMATRDSDQALSGLFRFVVVPLFLFSGTFFPVTQLPETVQPVVLVVPLWHGVELTRALALGTAPALAWWLHVAVVVALLAVGTLVGARSFERRLLR